MQQPNILLIVWDTCRADYVNETSTLESLAADNVSYDRAIAPATWSLPSHVSMFEGIQAHEHGIFDRTSHVIGELELVDSLAAVGYRTAGISANPFASPHFNFDVSFDAFWYTNGVDIANPAGIDARQRLDEEGLRGLVSGVPVSFRNEHTKASLANLIRAAIGWSAETIPILQQIPHPWFAWPGTYGYSYKPTWNTDRIESWLKGEADRDEPFFLFANYMDPHHPYRPPEIYIEDQATASLTYNECYKLNEDYGQPWTFLEQQLEGDTFPQAILSELRELYAGEVRSLDDHLAKILRMLDQLGLRKETVVIVTADHGELLGERDRAGLQRIGHEGTVHDCVTHVPLVVAHPSLPEITVSDPVTLLDLPEMITSFVEGIDPDQLIQPPDGPIICTSPAHGGDEMFDAFDLPHEIIAEAVTTHAAVGYHNGWKVVVDSTGERYAEMNNEEVAFAEAPTQLVDSCESVVSALLDQDDIESRTLNESLRSQLEDLGYL